MKVQNGAKLMNTGQPRDAGTGKGRRRAGVKHKVVRTDGLVTKAVSAIAVEANPMADGLSHDEIRIQPIGSTTDQKARGRRNREEPDATTAQVRLYGQKLMAMRKRF